MYANHHQGSRRTQGHRSPRASSRRSRGTLQRDRWVAEIERQPWEAREDGEWVSSGPTMGDGRGAGRSGLLATPLSNRQWLRHSPVAAQCAVFSRYVRRCFWAAYSFNPWPLGTLKRTINTGKAAGKGERNWPLPSSWVVCCTMFTTCRKGGREKKG